MENKIRAEESLKRIAALADTLEAEEGVCPVSRIELVTWIANQLSDLDVLIAAGQEPPPALRKLYAEWIRVA
ncbi:hypothetical protein FQ192_31275 [Pseudomonas sp. ANT_J12]|uniref:Uncharacterized protein n=1 Tax=Pseudomonas prosekii TaxID=1148509 RepID=A0A2U2D6X6_9PSED|nr:MULTISPECIES: hypothetical protein [Pseudomonas]KAA0982681.1 hypothetical protein FQ192_31275 [Pseudomonas sp. ANT_J12]PWE43682.1 hypothetical protein C9I49_15360 [Pseudomonas prosekii]